MLSMSEIENKYIVSDWNSLDYENIPKHTGLSSYEFKELIYQYNGRILDKSIEFKNKKDATKFIKVIDDLIYIKL